MIHNRASHLRKFLSTGSTRSTTPNGSNDQLRLTIGRNLDLILQDWRSLFDTHHSKKTTDHPYSELYRPDLRFRIAPHTEPGGLSFRGLWVYRLVRPVIRYSLLYTVGASKHYMNPRMVCIPEDSNPHTGNEVRLSYSFKWRIESTLTMDGTQSCILGGMAHYRFDKATGKIQSIQVDRIVPPIRPGNSILAYLRLLQDRLGNPSYTTNKSL